MAIADRLRAALYRSALWRLTLSGRTPRVAAVRPADPWPGDARLGAEIVAGEFRFAGRRHDLGLSPFAAPPPGIRAQADLHSFRWLRHLRDVGTEDAAAAARALLGNWLATADRWDAVAWRSDVLGERIANWLAGTDNIGIAENEAARESIGRQIRHLIRVAGAGAHGPHGLSVARGLIVAGLAIEGYEPFLRRGLALLGDTAARHVLPDGGHASRCPARQLDALETLIGIRATLLGGAVEMPLALQSAIDRMAPMLRSFCHGDGRLALFNDGNEDDAGRIAQVLAASNVRGKPLTSAPHSGFQRLAAGKTVLIVDTGGRPLRGFADDAHAGALSFEMSVGRHRIVVNCGAHPDDASPWRDALRATAAHSTVVVEDRNSDDLSAETRREAPACQRSESEGNTILQTRHDGYLGTLGIRHARDLYLSATGNDVRGKDVLSGPAGRRFQARFHLHPEVKVLLVEGGSKALLRLPGGEGWRFIAAGAGLGIEESVYHGRLDEIRRGNQIVLSGITGNGGTTVKWSFKREGD